MLKHFSFQYQISAYSTHSFVVLYFLCREMYLWQELVVHLYLKLLKYIHTFTQTFKDNKQHTFHISIWKQKSKNAIMETIIC